MRNIRLSVTTILSTVAVLGISVLAPLGQASAASNSLGVNPRRDYTVKSGDKLSDTLYVSNLSKTDTLNISIQLVDFGAKNETGSPALLLNQKDPTRWSLKPYLTIAKSITIAPAKSVNVPFTIAIPKNVGAGSYYGAVKYSADGSDGSNSNVSLTSSSATLVFVRVPGEANDAMLLNEFGAFTPDATGDNGTFGKLYVGSAPKYLAYRVTNKGNVAEQPTGSAIIKNVFSKKVKVFQNANPDSNTVLLDQTRRIQLCINESKISTTDAASGRAVDETKCNDSKLFPGRYTAKLDVFYGDSNNGSSSHELGAVTSFWYLPFWFMGVVIVLILVLAGVILLIVRKLQAKGRKSFSSRR